MPIERRETFRSDQMEELEKVKRRRQDDGFTNEEFRSDDGSSVTLISTRPDAAENDSSDMEPDKTVGSTTVTKPASSSPTGSSSGKLAWGAKVSDEFRKKVRKISADIGCNPDFLMAAMAFETRETFSPKIINPQSGATGLIQFMKNTAIGLGTTTAALAKMSAEDQLDFVAKYFDSKKGKLHTLEDVYMAILFPAAVGKPNNHVLFTKPSTAYKQNEGLDLNKNGQITKAEAAAKVQEKLVKGMKPGNVG
jgi:hypothetical protein